MYDDQTKDTGGLKFGRPMNWGKRDRGVTNCSWHCQIEGPGERLSQQEPPPYHLCSPESRIRRLHSKDGAFRRLPPLMWTGGVLQSIPGALIMRLPCITMDPLGLSTSKHKLTLMFSIGCSTAGTISSLFSIIGSLAAGIKPLLVSDLVRKTVVGTYSRYKLPHQSLAINGSADLKMVLQVKLLTSPQILSQLVQYFRNTVLIYDIVTNHTNHNWKCSVMKCIVEYQRPHLLCQRRIDQTLKGGEMVGAIGFDVVLPYVSHQILNLNLI